MTTSHVLALGIVVQLAKHNQLNTHPMRGTQLEHTYRAKSKRALIPRHRRLARVGRLEMIFRPIDLTPFQGWTSTRHGTAHKSPPPNTQTDL